MVRVLDHPQSLDACCQAGLRPEEVIAGRGPFSVDDNRRHLCAFAAGVLVTKDSGTAGGTVEKLAAARAEGCHVIVIARPALGSRQGFTDLDGLLTALAQVVM
jgi:precorrin-6x reductase